MAQAEEQQVSPTEAVATGSRSEASPRAGGKALPERARNLWDTVTRATVENPVLVKEFRTRMRGARTYWLLLGYTLLLAGVVAFMYFLHEANASQQDLYGNASSQGAQELGRGIYYFVFIAQALMVALITPAITAGTVTIEREQRSYELLVTTPLRPVDLIRGKLSAAVSFVVLLLTASLPLVSLSFLVGGVSPAEIFFSYLIVAICAGLYGAIGIFWSAALQSTAVSTVVSYLTVLSLFVLTLVPGVIASTGSGPGGAQPWAPFQSVNPIWATFRAVQPEAFFGTRLPAWVAGAALNLLLAVLVGNVSMARLEHFEPPRPFWTRLWSTLLWVAFSVFLFGPILGSWLATSLSAIQITEGLGATLVAMLVLVALVTPIFNTGDLIVRRGESAIGRYLSGFLPHRMFGNDLSCGFPLMMAWTLFLLALVPIAVSTAGKGGAFNPSALFLPGALVIVAVVVGLAGIGNFLSVSLPSRWAACILTYLAAVVLMVLPLFTHFVWQSVLPKPPHPEPLYQVLYLAPYEALGQLASPSSFWSIQHPPMALGRSVPVWVVTSLVYLGLGLLCFLLTAARVNREGKQLQARMEATERAMATA